MLSISKNQFNSKECADINIEMFIAEYGPSRHSNAIISDIQRLIINNIFPSNIIHRLNPKSHEIFNLLLITNNKDIDYVFKIINLINK